MSAISTYKYTSYHSVILYVMVKSNYLSIGTEKKHKKSYTKFLKQKAIFKRYWVKKAFKSKPFKLEYLKTSLFVEPTV